MTEVSEEGILVFGYACTLFRDDERALFVDQGQHLIPWMGDPNMPIDRYDARGTLSDLGRYEALPQEAKLSDYLSAEDILIEEMCEDERYRSLRFPDKSEPTTKDSSKGSGAAIGFNYNASAEKQATQPEDGGISLHQMATVIEKTSLFIASQGAQMEILMRAKEAHNPKFQFLNPDNPYHPIYKQVLEKKRARASGGGSRLLPPEATLQEVEQSLRNLTRNLPSAAPNSDKTAASTSSSGSAYSRLVEKIRENQAPPPQPEREATPPISIPPPVQVPPPEPPKEEEKSVIVQVPPLEEQMLIDQTASYVCRNGGDKLAMVRKRQPEKFAFLRSDNKYNTYYQYKVALYHEMKAERHREQKAKAQASANHATAAMQDPAKHFPLLKGFFR